MRVCEVQWARVWRKNWNRPFVRFVELLCRMFVLLNRQSSIETLIVRSDTQVSVQMWGVQHRTIVAISSCCVFHGDCDNASLAGKLFSHPPLEQGLQLFFVANHRNGYWVSRSKTFREDDFGEKFWIFCNYLEQTRLKIFTRPKVGRIATQVWICADSIIFGWI